LNLELNSKMGMSSLQESYTALLQKEGEAYVALCPELDVASQGPTIDQAIANLKEAVELFLECADPKEIEQRTVPVPNHPELKPGTLAAIIRQSGILKSEFES
jgi:predicted RNase H-like HicB family nuclease